MPETILRKQRVKADKPVKVLKQVDNVSADTIKPVVNTTPVTRNTTERSSVISETKIKKVLDEERINKSVICVIKKIKESLETKQDVKKVLNEKELEVVGEYIKKYKKKLEKEDENGKGTSINGISLRAFIDQKYKFKKDLSTYFGIICDLFVEEIIKESMEHVVSIDKKLINTSHILGSRLSDKLLYPLYCNLPSFVSQTNINEQSETTTPLEDTKVDDTTPVDENTLKVNRYFMGNIKTIFNNLRGENVKSLKIQRKFQEFLSTLIVEFLDRIIHPLIVTVNNNSKNRVVVQSTSATIVEFIMADYSWNDNKYPELLKLIQQRWVTK